MATAYTSGTAQLTASASTAAMVDMPPLAEEVSSPLLSLPARKQLHILSGPIGTTVTNEAHPDIWVIEKQSVPTGVAQDW